MRKHFAGNPWRAAKGRVYQDQVTKTWHAYVLNAGGVVVWRDNTGLRGYSNLITLTARMVYAVRLMDGIGQGKRMKEFLTL